jgi:hypothetical protein
MRFHRCLLVAALVASLVPTFANARTWVAQDVNGDDHFRTFLSTTPTDAGYLFVSGTGWSHTYPGDLLLPIDGNGARYRDYYVNVYVEDLMGGGPDVLGKFTLAGDPGCLFDNGTVKQLTNTQNWLVTKALPQTWQNGTTIPGYSPWDNNYQPPYVQPTLVPQNLGANVATSAVVPADAAHPGRREVDLDTGRAKRHRGVVPGALHLHALKARCTRREVAAVGDYVAASTTICTRCCPWYSSIVSR